MKKILLFSLVFAAMLSVAVITPVKADTASCTPNATRQCVSNISYWYNSCGALQSIYQNCNTTNQVCQSGQCVNKTPEPSNHYTKSCYNGNLYWYSSTGTLQDIAQNCQDNNACTVDGCSQNKCSNELKCDGSTCALNSQEFTNYCANTGQNPAPNPTPTSTQGQALSLSLFAAKDSASLQWEKSINVSNNDKLNFLITVKNISTTPADNVKLQVNVTNNVAYTGNLKVDNALAAGDIATGIDLGTIPAKTSKVVSFTGTVQSQTQGIVQITTNVNSNTGLQDSDYIVTTLNSNIITNPATAAVGGSVFNNVRENFYIWLIIAIVLIVVFVIIYRRLGSST